MSERFKSSVVHRSKTLVDAMWALQNSGVEIALVVDDKLSLVGTLTDGDVRRALLGGASLTAVVSEFMQTHFISVPPSAGRAEVTDIMRARGISQIPIIGEQGRLLGLHLLQELLGAVQRPNWAVVMAGGKGLRLRPITEHLPKPMLLVAGRPILERILLHLVGFGIRRVFLAVNYMAEKIEAHFGDGGQLGCQIEYLRETQPLGTGGALSLLPSRPEHPLLVLNGDILTQIDISRMFDFHVRGGHAITVGVHDYSHTVPFGVFETQGDLISRIQEKPTVIWPTNAGIYVVAPHVLERVPANTEFGMPSLLDDCLTRNEPVGAHRIEGDWIDVGRHRELQRARGETER